MSQHPFLLSAGHQHHHGCGTKHLRFPAGNFFFLSEFVAEKHLKYGNHK